ncbi:hypothetical protein B0H14DRAFT_3487199 [Mycena olivaceomarginata]|nr:hypothetical protein B0H14DRAFT_3487199 [Mycena olivaceomarginata]
MCTNAALGLGLISWCFLPLLKAWLVPVPQRCAQAVPGWCHGFSTASVVLSVVRAGFPGSLVEEYLIFESCARIPGPPPLASCSGPFVPGALVLSWRSPPTASVVLSAVPGWCHGPLVEEYRSPTARIILGAEVLPPPRTWQEARARHSPPVTGVPELPGQSRFSIAATSASGPATIQKAKGLKPCSPPWTFATSSAEMPLPPLISPASKMPSRASIHTTVDLLRSSVETRVTAPPPSTHSAPPSGIHTPVKLHLAPAVRPQLQEFLVDQGKRALCSMISPIP